MYIFTKMYQINTTYKLNFNAQLIKLIDFFCDNSFFKPVKNICAPVYVLFDQMFFHKMQTYTKKLNFIRLTLYKRYNLCYYFFG